MLARMFDDWLFPNRIFNALENAFEEDSTRQPLSNIVYDKTQKTWEVEIELPGLTKDDVSIKIIDGALHVTGENKDKSITFQAQYYLGKDIDQKSLNAKMEDGLLIIKAKTNEPEEKFVDIQ